MSRPQPPIARHEFERLVREHHADVWRAASRAVRDRSLAEDAAQDVFMAVLEGRFVPETGPAEGRSLRWLAARRALELGRGDGRRRAREERYAMEQQPADVSASADDERARILDHVEALPDDLRAALRLRYEEDMTWDAVGDALWIAPSSAHERVQRALDRLRATLRRAGLPALALDVEARLADLPVPGVPQGLAPRLLALGLPAAAPLPAALLLALGSVVVIVAAGLGLWLGRDPGREVAAEVALASPVPVSASARSDPPATESNRVGLPATVEIVPETSAAPGVQGATIEGRVLDPRGDPLEGIRVHAIRAGQKGGALPGEAGFLSRVDGTFRVEVERVEHLLELVAGEDTLGRSLATSASFRLAPAGITRVADLVVDFPGATHARGDWSLDVLVVDDGGRPVPRAIARIADPDRSPWSSTEAHGNTDEAGRVTLSGGRIGARSLAIDDSAHGFAPWNAPIELVPGRSQLRVALARGLEIRGRVTDLEGRPLGDPAIAAASRGWGGSVQVQVHARDGGDGPDAHVEPDGTFRVSGLSAGSWRLRIFAPGRSPARLEVDAGTTGLEIALKPSDDERDVGLHDAELHGRLVDDATGAAVLADVDAVEVDALWDLEPGADTTGAEFERDILPWVILGRPVQRSMGGQPPPKTDRFHVVGLDSRFSALVARVPGHGACVAGPFALGEREVRTGIELRLARPAPISGIVRDADGTPLAGAFVVLAGEGPYSDRQLAEEDQRVAKTAQSWLGLKTDANGRFAYRSLPPGLRARLAVLHEHREPSVSDWFVAGSDHVELRTGHPR